MLNRRVRPWLLPPLPTETAAQTNNRRDQAYFAEQIAENDEWLRRMGRDLVFTNKRVLDLGCGHGALSIFMAQCGAAKVVGVDLDAGRINFAKANLRDRYPQFADIVSFNTVDIAEVSGEFDMVVSKDTFEHIEDLGAVLGDIYRLLVPGGALASGFGPLYYSPFGDHGRFHLGVPWLHAVLPNAALAARASWREGYKVRRAMDLGLNQLTSAKLEYLIAQQPWSSVDIRLNQGSKRLFKLFNVLRGFAPIEKYFTVNAYLIARKGGG